jgi:hypothetical protein
MGNAFIYSLIYQCVYIPADALIATLALVALTKTGVLDTLKGIMQKERKAKSASSNNEPKANA